MIMSLLIVTILKLLLMMVKSSPSLKYFFGGENENFVNASNFLSLNKDNKEFISFLCSGMGLNIWQITIRYTLKAKIYFKTILIQKKILATFCWRCKMNQNKLYQSECLIIALKGIHVSIYCHFHWKKLITLICFLIKIQNIYCTNSVTR